MPGYICWTKHRETGVIMEDNEEKEDDDNIPGFVEYGANAIRSLEGRNIWPNHEGDSDPGS